MNTVPKEFQINNIINHNEYLIDGEICKWNGKQTQVFSTLLCDSDDKEPLLIGNTPEILSIVVMPLLKTLQCNCIAIGWPSHTMWTLPNRS